MAFFDLDREPNGIGHWPFSAEMRCRSENHATTSAIRGGNGRSENHPQNRTVRWNRGSDDRRIKGDRVETRIDAGCQFSVCGALAFRLLRRLGPLPAAGLILRGGVVPGSRNPSGNQPDDFITLLERIGDTKDAAIWSSPLDLARRINECKILILSDFCAAVKNQFQLITGMQPHRDAVLAFPTEAWSVPLDLLGDSWKRFEDYPAQCEDLTNTLVRKVVQEVTDSSCFRHANCPSARLS
ncbi:hypothetical protein NUU27_07030 [Nitratireductor sp. ZSWI3]|nr:hypothetical protein [Nitratireductor sp. ZSWI3]MCR4265930.1 hypothetical protein [Nitratireductor sp. ZSWI3]